MPQTIILIIKAQLHALKNKHHAFSMAAYMKTTMPFYGVRAKERRAIVKQALKQHPIQSQEEYLTTIDLLWNQSHREEKYIAIDIARAYPYYIDLAAMSLFEKMIREGAWWDFVDDIAINLIGTIVLKNPIQMQPILQDWINDSNIWIRRTAIICQNKFKSKTDPELLFSFCLLRSHENLFFIQKAIGWALREYAKTNPCDVVTFLTKNKEQLSSLSYKQATKLLSKKSSK